MLKKLIWWKTKEQKKKKRNCIDKQYGEIDVNQYYVIDVRTRTEYKEGHLDRSVNIPLKDIKRKIETIQPNKEKKILIYCQSGIRSKKAIKILEKLGYQNLYNLKGGLENIE